VVLPCGFCHWFRVPARLDENQHGHGCYKKCVGDQLSGNPDYARAPDFHGQVDALVNGDEFITGAVSAMRKFSIIIIGQTTTVGAI
jgi:hypothetical protein